MGLSTCPSCQNQVSTQATVCPRCGHPFGRSSSSGGLGSALATLLTLGVLIAGGSYLYSNMNSQARAGINTVASGLGVPIVPWTERAQTAAQALYSGGDGPVIAQTIQSITHPTGGHAQLLNYAVSVQGDQLVSRFDVAWQGGFVGFNYLTVIEWRCSQSGHLTTQVVSDNAMVGIADQNRAAMDGYFRNTVYPALTRRAN